MVWKIADLGDNESLASRGRRKRLARFYELLDQLPRPVRILDVGGTEAFWENAGLDGEGIEVTLLNLRKCATRDPRFESVAGDARRMPEFADGRFDMVFSNSVIEHVGSLDDQRRMADEVRRVGKCYFIQTPNRYFPVEPHFQFPLFQFLPKSARRALVRRFALGWYDKARSEEEAREWVDEIRLVGPREFRAMFPDAEFVTEWFCGLPKSLMAIRGPSPAEDCGECTAADEVDEEETLVEATGR